MTIDTILLIVILSFLGSMMYEMYNKRPRKYSYFVVSMDPEGKIQSGHAQIDKKIETMADISFLENVLNQQSGKALQVIFFKQLKLK